MIDASIVEAPRQRNTDVEKEELKAGQERSHVTEAERRQAVQVARLAWRSYQHFKSADLEKRAMILEVWAHRRGSLIRLFWTNGDLPLVAEWQGSVEV